VQPGVRQVVEDHQLAPRDPAPERLGEAGGADKVARSEGDQGRNVDVAQRRARVVGEDRVGLSQERVHGLGGTATHEVHQRVDELRPFDVHLGRETPREDAVDDDVRDGRQRGRERTPLPDDDLQIAVSGVPAAV
jgi:hypothetical protein